MEDIVFGIDLGTTYSCIAYVDEYDKATIVSNSENSPVTPSVVYYKGNGTMAVGEFAKEMLQSAPDNVCTTVKRQMGNREWTFVAGDQSYRPEEVSSHILKKLATDASNKLGTEVKKVVITCPAYFGLMEREMTQKAGEIAGLEVLDLLNEPTAAAISYGMKADRNENVLVYDLGGGTFDVTIIHVEPGVVEVIATGGDHNLGGKDWDAVLMKKLMDEFADQTGNTNDMYTDSETMGNLEIASESIKKRLSKIDEITQSVTFDGDRARVTVTRADFENLTRGLLESTLTKTRQMEQEAEKKCGHKVLIDRILLVGGSTEMPMVKEIIQQAYPDLPILVFDPNEAVAKGAAIYGKYMNEWTTLLKEQAYDVISDPTPGSVDTDLTHGAEGSGRGKLPPQPMVIKNVISKSFGVEFYYDDVKETRVGNLIIKQTTLPADVTIQAGTMDDNQTNVRIALYENESMEERTTIDRCRFIQEALLTDLPPRPAGYLIELHCTLNENGTLQLEGKDPQTGKSIQIEADVKNAMTQEEFEEAKKKTEGLRLIG